MIKSKIYRAYIFDMEHCFNCGGLGETWHHCRNLTGVDGQQKPNDTRAVRVCNHCHTIDTISLHRGVKTFCEHYMVDLHWEVIKNLVGYIRLYSKERIDLRIFEGEKSDIIIGLENHLVKENLL